MPFVKHSMEVTRHQMHQPSSGPSRRCEKHGWGFGVSAPDQSTKLAVCYLGQGLRRVLKCLPRSSPSSAVFRGLPRSSPLFPGLPRLTPVLRLPLGAVCQWLIMLVISGCKWVIWADAELDAVNQCCFPSDVLFVSFQFFSSVGGSRGPNNARCNAQAARGEVREKDWNDFVRMSGQSFEESS